MRASCMDCVSKHVGRALVLLDETTTGYEDHFIEAIGHLGEAEAESFAEWPVFSDDIREFRKTVVELIPELLTTEDDAVRSKTVSKLVRARADIRKRTFAAFMLAHSEGKVAPDDNV